MKKSNALYTAILLILVVFFTFFFSSKLWMGDDRSNKSMNFNSTILLSNAWEVKITDGVYDAEKGVLEVQYFAKRRLNSGVEAPTLRITLEGTKQPLEALITDMDDNEYGKWIQVQNVPRDYYYLRFTLTCKTEEKKLVSTVDQFGHESSQEVKGTKEDVRWVQVDYRSVLQKSIAIKDDAWLGGRVEMVQRKKEIQTEMYQVESSILQLEAQINTADDTQKQSLSVQLDTQKENLTALQAELAALKSEG